MKRPSGPQPKPPGAPFTWRGEQLEAIAAGTTWVITRMGNSLLGPKVHRGELWSDTMNRLREWMELHEA